MRQREANLRGWVSVTTSVSGTETSCPDKQNVTSTLTCLQATTPPQLEKDKTMLLHFLLSLLAISPGRGDFCLEGVSAANCDNLDAIIKTLFTNYSRYERPKPRRFEANNTTTDTVFVEINMHINTISAVNVVDMDFRLDILLRQRWYDPRLDVGDRYNYSDVPIHLHMRDIWLPDLFFRNSKSSTLHAITTPNTLAWITANGMITYSQKLTIGLFCHMRLWDFPMDTQYCSANIGSYGYSTRDLEFRWWNEGGYDRSGQKRSGSVLNAAVQLEDSQINEFAVVKHTCTYCDRAYKTTVGALLEFAFVNTAARKEAKVREAQGSPPTDLSAMGHATNESLNGRKLQKRMSVRLSNRVRIYCLTARRLDQVSAILYPLCFLLFNIVYWSVYLHHSQSTPRK